MPGGDLFEAASAFQVGGRRNGASPRAVSHEPRTGIVVLGFLPRGLRVFLWPPACRGGGEILGSSFSEMDESAPQLDLPDRFRFVTGGAENFSGKNSEGRKCGQTTPRLLRNRTTEVSSLLITSSCGGRSGAGRRWGKPRRLTAWLDHEWRWRAVTDEEVVEGDVERGEPVVADNETGAAG